MSKVMYFGVPAHGHTNPSLPLIGELVSRGEKVRYYSFPEFKDRVVDTGAEYCEYPGFPPLVDNGLLVKSFVVLVSALINTTSLVVDHLIEEIKKYQPDYIIHDSICVWGSYAAKACSIPTVTSISTFVFSKETTSLRDTVKFISRLTFKEFKLLLGATKRNKEIAGRLGITHNNFIDNLMNLSPLNICYTVKELQSQGNKLVTDRFKFVGPSINMKLQDNGCEFDFDTLKKPLIYVALGTILNSEEFFLHCAEALLDFHGTVIFSVGSNDLVRKLEGLSDNFIVRERVNQLAVLKHSHAFITHGGMNSVHESLCFAVPLGVYPFHSEQEAVAQGVVRTGCGVKIKRMDSSEIYRAVDTLLSNGVYGEKCRIMSEKFREVGGYITAVDEIEKHMGNPSQR